MSRDIEINNSKINRRQLLKRAGLAASILPMISVVGCGSSGSGSDTTATNTTSSANTTANTSSGSTTSTTDTEATNNTTWLSGGTAALEATFPPESDPLDLSLGGVICTLAGTNSYTIGPCYFDVDDTRTDISEGQPGIPMTVAFKLVDADCEPVVGATIEVWWCNWEGLYSADNSESTTRVSSFNSSFCSGNDSDALAANWFRGIQTTDADGNVYFLGCFPGWYPSRTTHIHVRAVTNTKSLVTQFCFEDEMANDIYQNHSDYTGSSKDTSNDRDTVFGSEYNEYTFTVEQQFDGSMLAYKAIQII